ncbi:hypothetical protein JVU11DRAFT_3672 [Chiua virens]|nr:hypothetical protein JVU11DRAFT_3672 [Chiua virens]
MQNQPPAWTSAPELSRVYGRFNEASEEDCDRGDAFCAQNAIEHSRLLPSSDIDGITEQGCNAWSLEFHITDPTFRQRRTFDGTIRNQSKTYDGTGIITKVETTKECNDCYLISNLPFVGGLYYRPQAHDRGVYFELTIQKMRGVIAIGLITTLCGVPSCLIKLSMIGTVSRPYPHFRLPGWHRSSAALHLDDMRKFYENPDGGQESGYWEAIGGRSPAVGDTIGCGYEFGTGGTLFFTFNGQRFVPDAFKGLYLGDKHDVYAAIGVDGENMFTVNFGGDFFKWAPGQRVGLEIRQSCW